MTKFTNCFIKNRLINRLKEIILKYILLIISRLVNKLTYENKE